jgi:uncharacterized cupin superfamily protein
MSHPGSALVDVRTLAEHPLVAAGGGTGLRMVAPGRVTGGRFGLVEYRLAPRSRGAQPHYHRTFSESFYVVSGRLTLYADGVWRQRTPEEMTAFYARHDQVMVEE